MNKTLLAIDPGATGGFAVLHDGVADAVKMHATPKDRCDYISAVMTQAVSENSEMKCYMELVGGYIAGVKLPGSAMFSFGEGYGLIQGCLYTLGIPFELVRPQQWQKALSVGKTGMQKGDYDGKTPEQAERERKRIQSANSAIKRDWKNHLKTTAQRLYPQINVTLANCDALLLLTYARRMEGV